MENPHEELYESFCHNILFKQLTDRRLEQPEYMQLNSDLSRPIIMATDGFWSDVELSRLHILSCSALQHYLETRSSTDDLTVLIRPGN